MFMAAIGTLEQQGCGASDCFLDAYRIMRRARVFAFGLVAALLLLAAGSSTSVAQPNEFCACIELERAAEGLSILSRMDWAPLERNRLGEIWPPATASCAPADEVVVEENFYALCCSSCGTCGGQLLENPDALSVSVRAIGAVICRMTEDGVREHLARLVESAVPQSLNAVYERVQVSDDVVDTYQWESGSEVFLLTSRVLKWRQWWVGRVETVRCETWDSTETWGLDDGSEVDIIDLRIEPEDEDERWVHLDYITTKCTLATQSSCAESEVDLVWKRLMASIDLTDFDVVSVSAQGCGSHYQTTFVKRNGDWVIVQ